MPKKILSTKIRSGGIALSTLQAILKSNSHQNNVILTQKQTYGSREQERESPVANPHIYSQLILHKGNRDM